MLEAISPCKSHHFKARFGNLPQQATTNSLNNSKAPSEAVLTLLNSSSEELKTLQNTLEGKLDELLPGFLLRGGKKESIKELFRSLLRILTVQHTALKSHQADLKKLEERINKLEPKCPGASCYI